MIPRNLLFTIFAFLLMGIYTDIQTQFQPLLTDSIQYMHNNTLLNHYGIQPDKFSLSIIQSVTVFIGFSAFVPAIFLVLPLSDKYGRKLLTVYMRSFAGLSGSLFCLGAYYLSASELFMCSEFMLTIQIPIRSFVTVVFISECSPDEYRGATSTATVVLDIFGQLLMYFISSPKIFGSHEMWFVFPTITGVLTIAAFLMTVRIPESPKWLVKMERYSEAREAIKFYHGDNCDTRAVMDSMIKEAHIITKENRISVRELFKNPTMREAFFIVFSLNTLHYLSPISVEKFYTMQIFTSMGFSLDFALTFNFIITLIFIPSRFAGTYIVDKFGRRVVLYLSGTILIMKTWSMLIAVYLNYELTNSGSFVKILFLFGYSLSELFQGIGGISLSSVLLNELFPQSAKITVVQITTLPLLFSSTLPVLFYPMLNASWPPAYYIPFVFLQPAIILYLLRTMPETKSKSVYEIIDSLDRQNNEKSFLLKKRSFTTSYNTRKYATIKKPRAVTLDHLMWNQ
ncbi:unnamed protein product [Caenorhabditis angaria]|uniref:Major facilitator superfamily (MFS) profile domain-containing protein n=1 Tax=Caenorhabditis angaria TaxID=860376 RepID=A0A9P1NA81_9PELO|nr:unnamed protein product [Caenorhabditis angaria]